MTIPIQFRRTPETADLPMPAYKTAGAAGMDIVAALRLDTIMRIYPGQRAVIPTGLFIALPAGYELQIRSRSGLALDYGIIVANSPGTVDEDYRGEVGIILINAGQSPFTVERGMRIAQGVVAPVVRAEWVEVESLDETGRGAGAYGSTGQ